MPERKRKVDKRDFDGIAEHVLDTFHKRKTARKDKEEHWDDIDRQVGMKPSVEFKKTPDGRIDTDKQWMAEVELPLQAQALEVHNADIRRLMFGDGRWYAAHSEVTDEYLRNVDFSALIAGDENEVPSKINQDNADKLVEGFLNDCFRQYDHIGHWDRINAESVRYGMGVGRARLQEKNVYIHEAKGTRKKRVKTPVIVPGSIRNVYLDDPMPSMQSATVFGPSHIAEEWFKLEDIQTAAKKGSPNPDDPDGGWMPANVRQLEADKNGFVQVLEMEGDLVAPRKTVRDLKIPGVIVTVAKGSTSGGKVSRAVIRLRFRKKPYSSYILAPYHFESATDIYPTGPLEKGRPIQMMATDALNRLLDSAMLKNAPPIGWDRTDSYFAAEGGPNIVPYAKWGTTDPVQVYDEIGGDPAALASALSLGVSLYGDLVGVLPARVGAQTVSHTTAFAKDAEIQRGASRTVDYVNATGRDGLTRWLYMAYDMARDEMKGEMSVYSESYGGFINLTKDALPENVVFEWFGASGPTEEREKQQSRLAALQLALQMDQISIQLGNQPTIDIKSAIEQVLREGKWTDVDAITSFEELPTGDQAAPDVPGAIEGDAGTISTALQGLAFGNR